MNGTENLTNEQIESLREFLITASEKELNEALGIKDNSDFDSSWAKLR